MKVGFFSLFGGCSPIAARIGEEIGSKNISVYYHYKEYKRWWNGILPKSETLDELLKFKPDFIVFDSSGEGELAQQLIKTGHKVIGSCEITDYLEFDRWFGIKILKTLGFKVPETYQIKSYEEAKEFVKNNEHDNRWVIKFNDNQGNFSSYVSSDLQDFKEELEHLNEANRVDFTRGAIIQKYIKGVELSCEGWFDGRNFILDGFNYTMEEKKFLTGGLGPSTGCEGNLVWKASSTDIIPRLLLKFAPLLRKYNYIGSIDVNSIVSERDGQVYAIELTPRFGYDAIYALLEGVKGRISTLFASIVIQSLDAFPIYELPLMAIRVSIPPYPYNDVGQTEDRKMEKLEKSALKYMQKSVEGTIVHLKNPSLIPHIWLQDVQLDKKNRLIIGGGESVVGIATSKRQSLQGSIDAAYSVVKSIDVPDAQYRLDIGQRAFKEIPLLVKWQVIQKPSFEVVQRRESKEDSKPVSSQPSQNNLLENMLRRGEPVPAKIQEQKSPEKEGLDETNQKAETNKLPLAV